MSEGSEMSRLYGLLKLLAVEEAWQRQFESAPSGPSVPLEGSIGRELERFGWVEEAQTNHYRLTKEGRTKALRERDAVAEIERFPAQAEG